MQITVQGRATASFTPERATVHLTIGFDGSDKQRVLAEATALANEFGAAVEQLRAQPDSPITWSALLPVGTRSWRPYSDQGKVLPLRHSASCQAKVKFRDFQALSRFVDAWGGRDGIAIGYVEWTLTEARRVREEDATLARAVEEARRRAQTMATAAGAGEVTFVELSDPGLLGGGRESQQAYSAMAMRGKAMDSGGGEGVSLMPEDVELEANVQARFEAN